MTPSEVIQKIALIAEAVGWQAGVGASETAGSIISVLSAKPELIDAFLRGEATLEVLEQASTGNGRLSFYNSKGHITAPQELRMSQQVRELLKPGLSALEGDG